MAKLIGMLAVVFSVWVIPVAAQDVTSPLSDAFKRTLTDPTTYAPAIVSFGSQRLDWDSSQVFFQHGSVEHNPQFTRSGLPDDQPIAYGAGNQKILRESVIVLQASLVNNFANRLDENALTRRYPTHRKLVRTLAWVERIGLASYLGYQTSILHFEQWRANRDAAQRLGY